MKKFPKYIAADIPVASVSQTTGPKDSACTSTSADTEGTDNVTLFKNIDTDGSLHINGTEYYLYLVDKYITQNPGLQMPSEYNNIGDYITAQFEQFKQFAGDDCEMNIDEFGEMLKARMQSQQARHEANQNRINDVAKLKEASDKFHAEKSTAAVSVPDPAQTAIVKGAMTALKKTGEEARKDPVTTLLHDAVDADIKILKDPKTHAFGLIAGAEAGMDIAAVVKGGKSDTYSQKLSDGAIGIAKSGAYSQKLSDGAIGIAKSTGEVITKK